MAFHGGALERQTDRIAAGRRWRAGRLAVRRRATRRRCRRTSRRPTCGRAESPAPARRSSTTSRSSSRSTGSAARAVHVAAARRAQPGAGRARRPLAAPALPAYDIVTDLDRIPREAARPARRPTRSTCRGGMRRADRAAAPRPWCQPDVVGLGRAGAHAPHRRPHRRAGRRRHDLARGPRACPARLTATLPFRTRSEKAGSGGEAVDVPGGRVAERPVAEPVVEPARPALPELPLERDQTPSAPVRRTRDLALGERRSNWATRSSSNARSAITSLCGEAQAPSWLPRGRDAK